MDIQQPAPVPAQTRGRPSILVPFFVMILIALAGAGGYFIGINKPKPSIPPLVTPTESAPSQGVACTMEARLCPDGSAVGRMPPNCEFAPCPDPKTKVGSSPAVVSSCIDYLGKPADEETCAGIPAGARTCQASSDCVATCSKGCLNPSWLTQTALADCLAMPQYSCGCADNVCVKLP